MDNEMTSILLIDDQPANLLALDAILSDLGQHLVKANSATEALKHLMQEDFAVILLDIQMPEINGFEAADLIRAREKSRTTPIIFLTAQSRSEYHAAQVYSTGAVDFLIKPFDPVVLKAKVSVFIEMARNTKRLEAEIQRRHKAEEEAKRLNAELERRVRQRTAHIATLNRRLEQMLAHTHDRVRNNLQVLTSLVEMQRMEATESVPVEALSRLETHIRILSMVHTILTGENAQNEEVGVLSVRDLLPRIITLCTRMTRKRKLTIDVYDVALEAQKATSLALVTDELCSNAFKHGNGAVDITFAVAEEMASLQVVDEGAGFAEDFDPKRHARRGMHLIESLTRHDLKGEVNYSNRGNGGACVTVTMPVRELIDRRCSAR